MEKRFFKKQVIMGKRKISKHRWYNFTEVNSKWIIDPNIKSKTLKLLEDNTGQPQGGHEFDDFLDTATKGQFIKEKC